jgi:tRNA G37 N-methylase Trm5
LIGLLDKARMIKDSNEELMIPSDKKFEKVFVKKGQRICKIQDETEFRKQAELLLKEYFEEFHSEKDTHEFCSSPNIEEIKVALLSFKMQ